MIVWRNRESYRIHEDLFSQGKQGFRTVQGIKADEDVWKPFRLCEVSRQMGEGVSASHLR